MSAPKEVIVQRIAQLRYSAQKAHTVISIRTKTHLIVSLVQEECTVVASGMFCRMISVMWVGSVLLEVLCPSLLVTNVLQVMSALRAVLMRHHVLLDSISQTQVKDHV